jgi:hypothetical protein
MKRSPIFALCSILCLLALLTACSSKESFSGGTFYNPSLMDSQGNPREIYTFRADGTGTYTLMSSEYPFSWKEIDGMILTSHSASSSSVFQYQNGYLIEPFYIWDGIIPSENTFDAAVSLSAEKSLTLKFSSSGTAVYQSGENEQSGSYVRNGDEILFGSSHFLVVDKKLCSNFLAPYEN